MTLFKAIKEAFVLFLTVFRRGKRPEPPHSVSVAGLAAAPRAPGASLRSCTVWTLSVDAAAVGRPSNSVKSEAFHIEKKKRAREIGRAIDAKLQTAVSPGEVNSMISVQRLLDLMVPKFCWFDLALHASLKSTYGVPDSICDVTIAIHTSCALTVFRALPSASYLS